MNQRLLPRRSLLLISFFLVLVDQLSKSWARQQLDFGMAKTFIPGLLQLRLVNNTGAAFSLFSDSTALLGVLSLGVAMGLLIWLWRSQPMHIWQGLALAFLLGGTIGNGLDRWRLGHVTDFLELLPINFPIFNAADIAINVAVICFGIDALASRHGRQQN